MSTPSELFGPHPDWLAHTLANANQPVDEFETSLPNGTQIVRLGLGLLYCSPPAGIAHRESLIVSAGVHGDETAPIEVLNELVNELIAGEWRLACPLLLILGNPGAMLIGRRFTKVNMNRLFNGAHSGQTGEESDRAVVIEAACQDFAARHPGELSHYDLHTAIRPSLREKFALYPFVDGRQPPEKQCEFLREADVHTLLLQHKKGSTFSSFTASRLGAESFTLELGKVRPFGENDLSRFSSVRNALRRRFRGEPAPKSPAGELEVFEVVHEIINTGPSFQLHVPDDQANFTPYEPGTVIWEDEQQEYRVGAIAERIVFPNPAVPVGQRAGLMIREASAGNRR